MANIVVGIPPAVLSLIQEGLIEREFHDSLYPNLAYRAEFDGEVWPGAVGQESVMTRAGLMQPVTDPLAAGEDPQPQTAPFEQWVIRLDQYGSAKDTHLPTSTVAASPIFLRDIKQLGLQAGQSINRVARNVMMKTYLSGQTNTLASYSATATAIRVASLNGFTDVVIPGTTVRPTSISAALPLPVTIGTGATQETKNAIAFLPDDPKDLFGPGTLTLSAGLANNQPIRAAVVSAYAPRIVRSAAGSSIDAIGAGDTLTLQQIINSAAILRNAGIMQHDDGTYHAHLPPLSEAQLYTDPVFQRLHQSRPEDPEYELGMLGTLAGVKFFRNQEAPNLLNVGTLLATVAASGSSFTGQYAPQLGAEAVNGNGVAIGRVLITGKGAGYERYLDESAFVTEAGTSGKIGEFDVVNDGVSILTEKIRLVIRAPQDRLQQKVGSAWSITTGFTCPSDITGFSGPERFKRALIMEFAS